MSVTASDFVWMNGKLVPTPQATVPLLNTGLHYGIAIFEGIRAYKTDRGRAVFRLRDHLERFEDSARIFGFKDVPYTVDQLVAATLETIRANQWDECYIRPLMWLG